MSVSFPSTEFPGVFPATLSEDFQMLNSSNNSTGHDFTKQAFVPALYVMITVIGIVGNGVVLYIMKTMVPSKSVTDVYVSNLAIADLLLLCTLPFWTIDLIMVEWIFGLFMCKIISCASYLNIYASVFFLTFMSLDRWFAVVKAIKSRKYRTVRNARIVCTSIWIIGLAFIVLPLLYRSTKVRDDKREVCSWDFPPSLALPLNITYSILRSGFGFLFPLLVIVFCYFDLIVYIHKRNTGLRRSSIRNDRLTAMVLVVISCFILCWMPNQVTNFVIFLIHEQVIDCDGKSNSARQNDIGIEWKNPTAQQYINQTQIAGVSFLMERAEEPTFRENLTEINRFAHVSKSFVCGRAFVDFHFITVCLGFSNSMMNPIVYSFMGAKFRKKLKLLLSCKSSHQVRFGSEASGRSFWTSLKYSTIRRICERAIGRSNVATCTRPHTPAPCVRHKANQLSNASIPLREVSLKFSSETADAGERHEEKPNNYADHGLFVEGSNGRLSPPCGSNISPKVDEGSHNGCKSDAVEENNERLIIPGSEKRVWI